MTSQKSYGQAMARAISDRIDHGWDETLPRSWWQRLLRRPAAVVHHEGLDELVNAFSTATKL